MFSIKSLNNTIFKADNYNYTKDITSSNIKNYFYGIKNNIIPFLKVTPKEFNSINKGFDTEFNYTIDDSTSFFILSIFSGKNIIWGDLKRIVKQVFDFISLHKEVKKIEIIFVNWNHFYLKVNLKEKNNFESIKKIWIDLLKNKFKESNMFVFDQKDISAKKIGFFFNKRNIIPYSINKETGLVVVPIDIDHLENFKQKDATLDKIYQILLKKPFNWEKEDIQTKASKVSLAYIKLGFSGHLVSFPPYVGDQIEHKINSSYNKEELIPGYKGKFVIQEHDATNLHFDLRLQFPTNNKDVLRSWALPKHKLPKGKDKILAVETTDHPMNYISFEGIIPEGEYGAGTVSIYDSGKYKILSMTYDKSYKLEFFGNKLKGIYNLVKISNKHFLLFKSK